MKSTKHLLLAGLLLLSLFSIGHAVADGKKTIFYNVTTDDTWRAGMALGQGGNAMKHGYKVVVFLNVRGVFLAAKSYKTDALSASGKSLQDMLKGVMAGGAKVIICPMCMKKAGLTKDDLIEGVIMGGPDTTMPLMTADDTVVLSY